MTPYIPFWVKVAMFAAFFAIMGAWAWLAHKLIYDWLPIWFTDILFVIGMSIVVYGLIRDRLRARRIQLRGPRLPGRPE